MLIPKYTITNSILKNIGLIEASKEVILNAAVIPAWENKLKKQALEKFIFFGARMEGNKILEEEVREVLEGREVEAPKIDVREVLNNKDLYEFITNLAYSEMFKISDLIPETLSDIHKIANSGLIPEERLGKFRTSQIVVRDAETGDISYTPPPAAEVEYLLEDLLGWLASEGADTHPIIKAAVVHLEIYRIHPFVEGNLALARALSLLILKKEGYSIRDAFVMEEYFDETLMEYYSLLQKVSGQKVLDSFERDLTLWIEYFTLAAATEINKLKEFVRKISIESRAEDKLGESFTLSERQMMIMEYLQRHKTMMNKDFRKIFPDFSDDTVLRELKFLKNKGLIRKLGGTKKATYALAENRPIATKIIS